MESRQPNTRFLSVKAAWPVYAIVPTYAGSGADLVAMQLSRELSEGFRLSVLLADFRSRGFPVWSGNDHRRRLDKRTWGGFVSEGQTYDTLEAHETDPRDIGRLLDHARARYQVTCADLSEAGESAALEVLRQADSIFLFTDSDEESIKLACHRADWFRSLELDDRAGLLLNRVRGGIDGAEAEDRAGLPVCAVLGGARELRGLAEWLAPAPARASVVEIRRTG